MNNLITKLTKTPLTREEFLLIIAHDPDMAGGIHAYGSTPDGTLRTRQTFLDEMVLAHEKIANENRNRAGFKLPFDGILLSLYNAALIAKEVKHFPILFRANNTTDIWNTRNGGYEPDHAYPHFSVCLAQAKKQGLQLGLFSVTLCGDIKHDLAMTTAYADFCQQASALGIRHILEIFNPVVGPWSSLSLQQQGECINDSIVRMLASQDRNTGPVLLKLPFNSQATLRELASYDSDLNVGILGGADGTSRDTFELVAQAAECGARAALFGRRIKNAVSPTMMAHLVRQVGRNIYKPEQAVEEYHNYLDKNKISTTVSLPEDQKITQAVLQN